MGSEFAEVGGPPKPRLIFVSRTTMSASLDGQDGAKIHGNSTVNPNDQQKNNTNINPNDQLNNKTNDKTNIETIEHNINTNPNHQSVNQLNNKTNTINNKSVNLINQNENKLDNREINPHNNTNNKSVNINQTVETKTNTIDTNTVNPNNNKHNSIIENSDNINNRNTNPNNNKHNLTIENTDNINNTVDREINTIDTNTVNPNNNKHNSTIENTDNINNTVDREINTIDTNTVNPNNNKHNSTIENTDNINNTVDHEINTIDTNTVNPNNNTNNRDNKTNDKCKEKSVNTDKTKGNRTNINDKSVKSVDQLTNKTTTDNLTTSHKLPIKSVDERSDTHSQNSSTLKKFASALSLKNPTNVVMLATQIALKYTLERTEKTEWRDIIMQDFYIVHIHYFPPSGSKSDCTPAHPYNPFKFKDYSPIAFRFFRSFFSIKTSDYVRSLCENPLKELSASGASGSMFFKTADDLYVLKSVDEREADFLKRLLPAYYINIKQNLNTLLPKFFGLYVYSSIRQKIRLCVMNNLLPSQLKLDEVYDLKGSTHKRRASEKELKKNQPTLKDLDFMDFHPQGFILQEEYYKVINETLERDTRVLEGFEIMDYSLLVGIHNVSAHATTCPCGTLKDTTRFDTYSKFNNLSYELRGLAIKTISENPINYQGGLPALNQKGDKLLIFLGIIDILQNYRLIKRLEHNFKSIVNDGKTISVNNPTFYKERFLNFCKTKVFHSNQKILMKDNPLEFGDINGQIQVSPLEKSPLKPSVIDEDFSGSERIPGQNSFQNSLQNPSQNPFQNTASQTSASILMDNDCAANNPENSSLNSHNTKLGKIQQKIDYAVNPVDKSNHTKNPVSADPPVTSQGAYQTPNSNSVHSQNSSQKSKAKPENISGLKERESIKNASNYQAKISPSSSQKKKGKNIDTNPKDPSTSKNNTTKATPNRGKSIDPVDVSSFITEQADSLPPDENVNYNKDAAVGSSMDSAADKNIDKMNINQNKDVNNEDSVNRKHEKPPDNLMKEQYFINNTVDSSTITPTGLIE